MDAHMMLLFLFVVFVILPILALVLIIRWLFKAPKGNEPSNLEIAGKALEAAAAIESLKASYDKEVRQAAAPPPPAQPRRCVVNPIIPPNYIDDDSEDYPPSYDDISDVSTSDVTSDDDSDDGDTDGEDNSDRYRRSGNIDKCYDCNGEQNHWLHGNIGDGICSECKGDGHAAVLPDEPCCKCGGTGECPSCSGKGFNYKY